MLQPGWGGNGLDGPDQRGSQLPHLLPDVNTVQEDIGGDNSFYYETESCHGGGRTINRE